MSRAPRVMAGSNRNHCLPSLYKDLEDQSYAEIAFGVMKTMPEKRT